MGIGWVGVVNAALLRTALATDRAVAPAGREVPDRAHCRCGHAAAAHEHYRPGSDCGACGVARCARFRRAPHAAVRRALRRALRRRPGHMVP